MADAKWTARDIPSQKGKTALITGANSGIGYQAALELARAGAAVLLGCRDLAKGRAALERLRSEVPGAQAEVAELDMASLASLHAFAASWLAGDRPLDLLINNAGVMAIPTRELTADGFERQFGTNHLGHFALTGLLLPFLLRAPAPRVVTVASLAHRGGRIEFDNLQLERGYTPWGAYNNSKLANILFARELDRRARSAASPLLSLPVHPGVSKTNIFVSARDLKSAVSKFLAPLFMQSDSRGALPTLYAATAPVVGGGEYIGPDGFAELKGYPTVAKPRPQALDEAAGRRLWQRSEELTGVVYPSLV